MMKDETNGIEITEFVGLRSKLYAFKVEEDEHKKCKGIKKSVMSTDISFKIIEIVYLQEESNIEI